MSIVYFAIAYVAILSLLVRFFGAVRRWDDEIRTMMMEEADGDNSIEHPKAA